MAPGSECGSPHYFKGAGAGSWIGAHGNGGNRALYGGGGGGSYGSGTDGSGAQGSVVITYTPAI